MIKWIRTSKLLINNSLSYDELEHESPDEPDDRAQHHEERELEPPEGVVVRDLEGHLRTRI